MVKIAYETAAVFGSLGLSFLFSALSVFLPKDNRPLKYLFLFVGLALAVNTAAVTKNVVAAAGATSQTQTLIDGIVRTTSRVLWISAAYFLGSFLYVSLMKFARIARKK